MSYEKVECEKNPVSQTNSRMSWKHTVLLKCFFFDQVTVLYFRALSLCSISFSKLRSANSNEQPEHDHGWFFSKQPTRWNLSIKLLQQKTSDKVSDQVTIKHIGSAMTCQVFLSCPGQEWVVVGLHAWFFGGSFFVIDRLNPRRILCKQRWTSELNLCRGGLALKVNSQMVWSFLNSLTTWTPMRLSSVDVSLQLYRWWADFLHTNRWNVWKWWENRCRKSGVFFCVGM